MSRSSVPVFLSEPQLRKGFERQIVQLVEMLEKQHSAEAGWCYAKAILVWQQEAAECLLRSGVKPSARYNPLHVRALSQLAAGDDLGAFCQQREWLQHGLHRALERPAGRPETADYAQVLTANAGLKDEIQRLWRVAQHLQNYADQLAVRLPKQPKMPSEYCGLDEIMPELVRYFAVFYRQVTAGLLPKSFALMYEMLQNYEIQSQVDTSGIFAYRITAGMSTFQMMMPDVCPGEYFNADYQKLLEGFSEAAYELARLNRQLMQRSLEMADERRRPHLLRRVYHWTISGAEQRFTEGQTRREQASLAPIHQALQRQADLRESYWQKVVAYEQHFLAPDAAELAFSDAESDGDEDSEQEEKAENVQIDTLSAEGLGSPEPVAAAGAVSGMLMSVATLFRPISVRAVSSPRAASAPSEERQDLLSQVVACIRPKSH